MSHLQVVFCKSNFPVQHRFFIHSSEVVCSLVTKFSCQNREIEENHQRTTTKQQQKAKAKSRSTLKQSMQNLNLATQENGSNGGSEWKSIPRGL